MKLTFLFIYLSFLNITVISKQKLECPLIRPAQLEFLRLKDSNQANFNILQKKNQRICRKNGKPWIVWSAKEEVITSNGSKLRFMQDFYVVWEDEDEIEIVGTDGLDFQTQEFKISPRRYGKVKKTEMLLWANSLINDSTDFRIKCLTVLSEKTALGLLRDEILAEKVRFYSRPVARVENIKEESGIFRFYYVYKQMGDWLLLGKNSRNTLGTQDSLIMAGWINRANIVFWSQRQVLEPNWDSLAIKQRRENDIQIAAFLKKDEAKKMIQSNQSNGSFWNDGVSEEKWKNYVFRWPIFNNNDTSIYEVGVVDYLRDREGKKVPMTENQIALLLEEFQRIKSEAKNIDIVFVLDGTKSMGDYINPVKEGLNRAMSSIENRFSEDENKFRFGLVVYRDLKEIDGKKFEVHPLTENRTQISNSLNSTIAYHKFNQTHHEAMYHGLDTAFSLFGETDIIHTKVIILVGDAGGHDDELATKVQKRFQDSRAKLIAIQARYIPGLENDPYFDFLAQTKEIIVKQSEFVNKNAIDVINKLNVVNKKLDLNPGFISSASIDKALILNPERSAITSGIRYSTSQESFLKPELLQEFIEEIIVNVNIYNNERLTDYENMVKNISRNEYGGNRNESRFTVEFLDFMRQGLSDLESFSAIFSGELQFLVKGFVPRNVQSFTYELYRPTIFIDKDELDNLIQKLKEFTAPNSIDNKRIALEKLWKEMLVQHYGADVFRTRKRFMRNQNASQLMGLVTGLPSQSEFFKDLKYSKIESFTYSEISRFEERINAKVADLESIFGDKAFIFDSYGLRYYWIPPDFLP